MDELAGRKVAMKMNLAITGSIGILLRAFKKRLISGKDAEEALNRIRESNRHISNRLIKDALDIIKRPEMWIEIQAHDRE